MSASKALLQGQEFDAVLMQSAVEAQLSSSVDAALTVAGKLFESLGGCAAIVTTSGESRYRSEGALIEAALRAVNVKVTEPTLVAVGHQRAVAVPLLTRSGRWGTLIVAQDDYEESHLPTLGLFGMQLSLAIELREGLEHLDRRTVELNLVHELAVAGPRADSVELCRHALTTVCSTSDSDVGSLHRFDQETGEYVLVGDVFGYSGPLVEFYRRFKLRPNNPFATSPVAVPATSLPAGGTALLAEGLQHLAIVPLSIEGKAVGMLTLARRKDMPYTRSAVRSAEIIGVQMASLLERARLYDEANRLYRDLKVSYDELGRTQQELVRHERLAALGELAAVMAHEVRNPLGVIFNSLTTLKRLLKPTGDADMLLNMVGEEADRLNRIVGDLLDFVRPYELVKKQIAVEPIITGAVDSATQSSVAANVRVVKEFPRELPAFPLDAHLLKQALVNLIVNAAQAMPRGGTVTVRASVETDSGAPWLTIFVRDEGVGLSERATAKMFQPFFTTKATGTGLGLAVVKRIVDAHLGEVHARPNDNGKGTTFVVRFPPTTETRSGALTPPRPSASARG
ncbi:MAG: ATP-binding protein [Archangium sp.]